MKAKTLETIVREELSRFTEAIGFDHQGEGYENDRLDRDEAELENENLQDFWMNELNTALIAAMAGTGVGNKMNPSDFLEAILPVLEAYGSGPAAEEMVAHVRNNQDTYSPGRADRMSRASTAEGKKR